jgi:hypothetical protein
MKKAAILVSVLFLFYEGCKKDEEPPVTPPSPAGHYGSGTLAFTAAGAGGDFTVTGKYKPSDQFATDSFSEGAGGFVHDTSLFQRPVGVMIAGYFHHLVNGTLNERWLVITLHDTSGVIAPGDYPFAPSNAAQSGQTAYLYFFLSDTVSAYYEVFIPKDGTLHLASFNFMTRHCQGTFSGILQALPPDTTQIQIANGQFDLTCVANYFNP